MKYVYYFFLCFILATSCRSKKEVVSEQSETEKRKTTTEQTDLKLIDSADSFPQMPITGIAENRKGGAVVVSQNVHYWIEGLDSWEDRFHNNPVRVWGDPVIRYDAPVFMDTTKEVNQGIPVYSEEDMQRQSKRYWITNARYELLRP